MLSQTTMALRGQPLQQVAELDDAEAADGAGRDGHRAARLSHDAALRVADAPRDAALEALPQVVVDEDLQDAGAGSATLEIMIGA
jgi:hypothetical protein